MWSYVEISVTYKHLRVAGKVKVFAAVEANLCMHIHMEVQG